eukprot:4938301-Lingulodinium_polyedra.AAC.1
MHPSYSKFDAADASIGLLMHMNIISMALGCRLRLPGNVFRNSHRSLRRRPPDALGAGAEPSADAMARTYGGMCWE